MIKNPVFTLIVGLMIGLALGYVLAENQPVPPAKALTRGAAAQQMPEGHPPVEGSQSKAANSQVARQASELQSLLAQNPGDVGLMAALGNLYFDASMWSDAQMWYERALEQGGGDSNVMTDLAVVYRNLKKPERSLALLDSVLSEEPDHWQALYNRVVVLHFDLHRHDDAAETLTRLEGLAAENPRIPDLSSIAAEVRGH